MFKTHRNFDLSTGVKSGTLAVLSSQIVAGAHKNVSVLYHQTCVVEKRGRTVTLRNGGWDTVSTRTVLNRALSQIAGSYCHVYRQKGETLITQNGIVKTFKDGMKIKVRQ